MVDGPLCPLGAGFGASVVLVVAFPGPWACGVSGGCTGLLDMASIVFLQLGVARGASLGGRR